MKNRPTVDHSVLSPSGRVSKRSRDAAIARTASGLFPPGYWDREEPTDAEATAAEIVRLRRQAKTLRDLAARGMSTKRYTREADALDARANELERA